MHAHFAGTQIIAKDMAASLAFYRALGLAIPPEADQEPHVEAVLPGGLKLTWDTYETIQSFDKEWQPPTSGGHRMMLSFGCDGPAGVDAAYAELVGLGYHGHLEPWDAFWGMRYASVHDPDGNPVDLFADLEQTEQTDSTQ